MTINLKQVKENPFIQDFIKETEKYLNALGYTDHGHRHINIVADRARSLAKGIGLNNHQQELAAIAGYCHDMGNFLGRTNHHYFGASLFSQIFLHQIDKPNDLSIIMQAITSHDKNELKLVNKISAILILADKSDVHRTRVKTKNIKEIKASIHDRVNYSVTKNDFKVNPKTKEITLKLKVDTKITKPLEYFEIFTARMTYCRLAAKYLNYNFVLVINNFKLS
jgi:uncharacterized protein